MADTRTEGLQYCDRRSRDTGLAVLQIAATRQHCKLRRYHFWRAGQALALAMHSEYDYRLTVSLGETLGRAFTFRCQLSFGTLNVRAITQHRRWCEQ